MVAQQNKYSLLLIIITKYSSEPFDRAKP